MDILGISAFYHDSAAALVRDGEVIAAAQEERFTRKKQDAGFPVQAIRFCLKAAGKTLEQIDHIVFYEKPFVKFERLLETYLAFAPSGLRSFVTSMPSWLKEKLFLKHSLKESCAEHFGFRPGRLLFTEHHQSHAAAAFYPSPFTEAAILCLDGVGEWATTSAWKGNQNKIEPLWEIRFPHSLGLLYSAITYYTGFKVNSGEYKIMGLAPYGKPKYVKTMLDHLVDIKPDGTMRLNMDYFDFATGLTMTSPKFDELFGGPPRVPETTLTQKEMDLARSIQEITEDIMLKLARTIHAETGSDNLCLAGGVALNCVANGRVLREGPFKNLWIQPAAGDAGGALGAALAVWYEFQKSPRTARPGDLMKGCYLGPTFSSDEIAAFLQSRNIPARLVPDDELFPWVAGQLADEKVIGWFSGPMEFGPRALGARSIIGDPRSVKMQSIMNLKIKFRESFRPFAPSVLRERVADYFDLAVGSPYMLLVAPVKPERRMALSTQQSGLWGIELLNVPKSDIPAVTHVDYSARVQTVHADTNPRYHRLIREFEKQTGCGVIVNTSFNVRGEPIVCTPEDALRCFLRTNIDTLVLENWVIEKSQLGPLKEDQSWMKEFELD
jgi:carbamoyltransferase